MRSEPSRRRVLATLATLPAAALAGAACSRRQDGEPPNVVLVIIDTCRADRVGVPAGPDASNTPVLDHLAGDGLRFLDCLAQSSGTGPSHRSLFSGQYVHRHGMYDNFLTEPPWSLASLLRDAGWRTAAFTGGGYVRRKYGLDHGFEVFLEPAGVPWIRPLREAVEMAGAWLRQAAAEPFLLFVHGYDPHCPYWPPEPWRSRYAGWYRGGLDLRSRCGIRDFRPLLDSGALGAEERRWLDDLYKAGVAAADAALGRLLDQLAERGVLDRSLVLVTSDHGESLGEHDWVGHTRMWNEQLQVPLVLRFPPGHGAAWRGTRPEPVELVDLAPTILAWLGRPIPAGMQGRNLLPLLEGGVLSPPRTRRLAKFGGREAVVAGRWKLILRRKAGEIVERRLYDLEADPGETRDLAATREGASRLASILEDYLAWREATREEDARYRGRRVRVEHSAEEEAALESIGYAGAGEDPAEVPSGRQGGGG